MVGEACIRVLVPVSWSRARRFNEPQPLQLARLPGIFPARVIKVRKDVVLDELPDISFVNELSLLHFCEESLPLFLE